MAQNDPTADVWEDNGPFLTTGSFTGRVGIGTTAPVRRLHVNSTGGVVSLFESNHATGTLFDLHSIPSTDAAMRFQGGANWTIGNDNSLGNAFVLGTFNNFPSAVAAANKFLVVKTSGQVGFGLTNPQDRFEIRHATHPAMRLSDNAGHMGQTAVATSNGFYSPFAQTGDVVLRSLGGGGVIIGSHGVGRAIRLATQEFAGGAGMKERLTITHDGKIGVNTNAPVSALHVNGETRLDGDTRIVGKLALGINPSAIPSGYAIGVNGGIICEEVRVLNAAQWPDYVFAEDYALRSLDQVEDFIEENHHLPNFPAAAEVESEGQDLAQMQTRLVQTVEELTLYLLELKAENEALKDRVAALEGK